MQLRPAGNVGTRNMKLKNRLDFFMLKCGFHASAVAEAVFTQLFYTYT